MTCFATGLSAPQLGSVASCRVQVLIECICAHFLALLISFLLLSWYRWVPLKPDFLGAWKSVRLKHYLAYPIIIISLITQRNLAIKIRAKQESGLTAVCLKWDPPVSGMSIHDSTVLMVMHMPGISLSPYFSCFCPSSQSAMNSYGPGLYKTLWYCSKCIYILLSASIWVHMLLWLIVKIFLSNLFCLKSIAMLFVGAFQLVQAASLGPVTLSL